MKGEWGRITKARRPYEPHSLSIASNHHDLRHCEEPTRPYS
jgi:hypothetical protein